MNESQRKALIHMGWDIHSVVEQAYQHHPAAKHAERGQAAWLEKQRLLLADMAIHLLQTAIQPGEIELDKLKDNLHAILTISDQFLPLAQLKKATERIYLDQEQAHAR